MGDWISRIMGCCSPNLEAVKQKKELMEPIKTDF